MSIHSDIKEEMKEAVRLRDRVRLTALRSIIAEFTNEIIKKGAERDKEIDDETAEQVIVRLVKQRRDSIEQFEKAGRHDLATIEQQELSVLEKYLPEQMTEKEIEGFLKELMAKMKVSDRKKPGIVMSGAMQELKGRADGRAVKRIAEKLIGEWNEKS